MYFDEHEIRRAQERHAQLLTEARILRLLRAARAPARSAPTHQPESLVARVFNQLRQRRALRA